MPHDPIIQKRASNDGYNISDVNVNGNSSSKGRGAKRQVKEGTGKTGAPLRFHAKEEYAQLNPEQKEKLYEFRNSEKATESVDSEEQSLKKRIKSVVSEMLATKKQQESLEDKEDLNK